MKKTLFIKLLGTYFIVIFLTIGVVSLTLSFMFRNYLYEQKENELIIKGKDIASIVQPMLIRKEDPHNLINLINSSDLHLGTEVWVTDKNGLVIATAANHQHCEGNALEETEYQEMQSGQISVRRGSSQYYQDPVIRVTVPVQVEKRVIGAIILYSPILGINQALMNIVPMIVYSGIFSLIVAFIVGVLMSKRISKPILSMTGATIALAKGEKKVEVNTDTGIEEINQLGKTFNYMSSQIEANEEQMKDLVANVSHELRGPLTSIKGFVEVLLDNKGKNEEAKQRYLNIINNETERLSKLVTDILISSKAETPKSYCNRDSIAIVKVIQSVLLGLEERGKEKGIEIIVKEKDLPPVCFDLNALKQVILNLIENSINYSVEGSKITLSFEDEENEIRVAIADEGIGIPKEDLPFIWDRFYRVDKARSRETGGTGLGLFIVKQLVEKNSGTVSIESQVGKGSVFSFTAPKYKSE